MPLTVMKSWWATVVLRVFGDCATFSLIDERSHHLCFGEFSGKFARGVGGAPHLRAPSVVTSDFGTHPPLVAVEDVDAYCYPHNETSTGVIAEPDPGRRRRRTDAGRRNLCGGRLDVRRWRYRRLLFRAAKGDGPVTVVCGSPCCHRRQSNVSNASLPSDRWIPPTLDLKLAIDNSRKDQTYNTPSLATVFLTATHCQLVQRKTAV